MNIKYTLSQVRQHFTENECELLSDSYKDNKQKLDYICKCGNQSVISFKEFKHGQRCKKCAGNEKLTTQFVSDFFKNQNCELLDEYNNCMSLMRYRCSCGKFSQIRWNDFKDGVRCNHCRVKRLVKTREENQSHWAITGVYSPPTNQIELICEICKTKYQVPKCKENTSKFCGKKCKIEWHRLNAVPPKMTLEIAKKISETAKRNGFNKGANHHNWKGGITSINQKLRRSDEYKAWRRAVYERDWFTCQKCKRKPPKIKITAHHIKEWSKYPDLRFEVSNGETLCWECHCQMHPSLNMKYYKNKGT